MSSNQNQKKHKLFEKMPPKKKNDKADDENKPVKINYDELIRANMSEIKFSPDRQTFGYTRLN